MLPVDVVEASAMPGHQIFVRFGDGAEGVVALGQRLAFRGVFAPLLDEEYFHQVRVDGELGTVVWPNGADLDPVVLHSWVTGIAIPDLS
jgi:hypothetical protein